MRPRLQDKKKSKGATYYIPHIETLALLFLFLSTTTLPSTAQTITGQFSTRASAAFIDGNSIFSKDGSDEFYADGSSTLRLMTQPSTGPHTFNIHYDISIQAGDLLEQSKKLGSFSAGTGSDTTSSEHTDLFDLRGTLSETSRMQMDHHLDRLSYQYFADWGTVTLGRDVVTWGNGLVFNPLDLLNPFSPDDIERDYKVGVDMLYFDLYPADWNHNLAWQVLMVPRRNPITGKIETDSSSLAAKTHFFVNESEWDLMLALHYDEVHFGVGSTHTIGGAVVRADILVGVPDTGSARYSAILNVDYSWTLFGMNTYGLLEYCFQSFGENNIADVFTNAPLLERVARGEVYTYGRHYLAGSVQLELHPLIRAQLSTILNLGDQSLLAQPHLIWDPLQNLQLAAGAQLTAGPTNTEFAGYNIPQSARSYKTPQSLFLWLKWYF